MDTVARRAKVALAPMRLPRHLTRFVGRESELRALRTQLQTSRLVTLTGTGGAGKSRLAAEVARDGGDAWPDGVCWVELAAETDVGAAVVATLELPGRGSPLQVAGSWLAARKVLLILDNCEHVVASCAEFCQGLLERSPEVTVLATSREPLGVAGEVRWAVAPLAETDALTLFEARARLVEPSFKLAAQNRDSVSAICVRLDRLPLAIEMAAARLDVMSERELLANLSDRFRWLASATRTAPERQQTMAAAIDWSYRLLTAEESRLFSRLGVFQGGFTLAAAQAVCGEPGGGDVLDPLSGLVRKSMVVAERMSDDSTRYRLLESQGTFAAERLAESADAEAIRRRHYEHFAAERWQPRDAANFWSAVSWAREHIDDGGLALALEIAGSEFTDPSRARKLLVELLDRKQARGPLFAKALNLAARLAARQGDHDASRTSAKASVELARELGDPELLAWTLNGAGFVYHTAGELEAPSRMYDEALELMANSPNQRLAIEVRNQRAWLAIEQRDFTTALEMLDGCVAYSRAAGDRAGTARFLESAANARLGLGRRDEAAADWKEALAIFGDLGDPFGMVWCLGGLSLVAAAAKDGERCLRLAAVVERLSREWSLRTLASREEQVDAATREARARLGTAKSEKVWAEGQDMSTADALEYALGDGAPAGLVDAGPLSRREREVVQMLAAGLTNKQIAERLFIAERTAEGHVERIRNKLGVRSRTEVATWAVEHGASRQPLDKRKPESKV